jgi:hypothetical protein
VWSLLILAVKIDGAAGDELGEGRAQKRGRGTDIEDIGEVAFRRTKLGLGQQLIEMPGSGEDTGGFGPRLRRGSHVTDGSAAVRFAPDSLLEGDGSYFRG